MDTIVVFAIAVIQACPCCTSILLPITIKKIFLSNVANVLDDLKTKRKGWIMYFKCIQSFIDDSVQVNLSKAE